MGGVQLGVLCKWGKRGSCGDTKPEALFSPPDFLPICWDIGPLWWPQPPESSEALQTPSASGPPLGGSTMTKGAKQGLLAISPPCPPGLAVAGITNRSRCFLWQSWDGSHSKDGSRDSGKRSLSAPRGALASPPSRHLLPTVRSVGASLVKPPAAGWGSGMGWGHTHPAERIQGYPSPPSESQMRGPGWAPSLNFHQNHWCLTAALMRGDMAGHPLYLHLFPDCRPDSQAGAPAL